MKFKVRVSLISAALMCCSGLVSGSTQFDAKQKTQVVNRYAQALTKRYVLVEEGKAFGQALLKQHQQGKFDGAKTKRDFVNQLNRSIRAISNDKHMAIMPADTMEHDGEQAPIDNIEASILSGNVGLLTINDFMGKPQDVDKAMAKLSSTDGLLIDVRHCPGGEDAVVSQLMSYFLPEGETIIEFYARGKDVRLNKSRQLPATAKRYMNKPIYVITSPFTGSACEELSFDIKYHDVGFVYGQTTAGAGFAMEAEPTDIGFGLVAMIPDSLPKHPKYDFTFEKVGVTADIIENPVMALDKAHQSILSQLIAKSKNNDLLTQSLLTSVEKTNTMALIMAQQGREYRAYLGNYGDKEKIVFDEGQLKINFGKQALLMQKISDDLFSLKFTGGGKIRFERDKQGNVTGYSLYRAHTDKWSFTDKIPSV
jgi:hypothetical protein